MGIWSFTMLTVPGRMTCWDCRKNAWRQAACCTTRKDFSAVRRNQASKIVSRARARFEFVIVNVMDEDGGGNREDCRIGLSFAFAMQHLPLSDFGCAGLRGNLDGRRPRQVKRLVQSYAPRGGVVRKGGGNIPISAFGRKPFVAGRRFAANGAEDESREKPGAAPLLRRISAPLPAPHSPKTGQQMSTPRLRRF